MATTRFDNAFMEGRRTVSSVRITYSPSSAGRVWCAVAIDGGDPAVHTNPDGQTDYADLTNDDGEHLFWFRKGPARRCMVEIHEIVPGNESIINGILPTIPVRTAVVQ
jgi:hypothetical protein